MADKPECFVIAPIGKEGEEVRKRSDQILKYILEPVADECGYRAVRADQLSEPGVITTQITDRILNAPMVVADLTGHNPNVFYELAVRHAVRKPYVQIIKKGEKIPFDVAGLRTIEIDHTDLDSVAAAKEEIRKQMTYTGQHQDKIQSPISFAIDQEMLKRSDDPEKRQLAEIHQEVVELRQVVESRLRPGSEYAYLNPRTDYPYGVTIVDPVLDSPGSQGPTFSIQGAQGVRTPARQSTSVGAMMKDIKPKP